MNKLILSVIVAMDVNRVIGKDNRMPWHLPAELAYFKKVTMGHPIIMGRKTHESIGKALPGRLNIVLTRDVDYVSDSCVVIHQVDDVLSAIPSDEEEAFVIGGAEIIHLLWSKLSKLYITRINHVFEGDTFFPEINEQEWTLISSEKGLQDEKNPYPYEYLVYERNV